MIYNKKILQIKDRHDILFIDVLRTVLWILRVIARWNTKNVYGERRIQQWIL